MRWIRKLLWNLMRPGFPVEVKGYWYCERWQNYQRHLARSVGSEYFNGWDKERLPDSPMDHPSVDGVMGFNPHRTGIIGNDRSGLVDCLIPAIRIGDRVGLYRIVREPYYEFGGPHSDWATWDDGKHLDLRLAKTVQRRR